MKNLLLFALALLSLFLFVSLNCERKALKRASDANNVLEADLKRTLTLKNRILTYKARLPEKTESSARADSSVEAAESKSFYIPPEGSFTYREFMDGEDKLDVKNYGFVLRFYAGGVYSPSAGFSPLTGARLFYFGRWGAGAAYSLKNGFLISAERRLDDILPFKNTALFLGINKNTAALGTVVFL